MITANSLKASDIDTITGVTINRSKGSFIVLQCYVGYEVVASQTKQRLASFADLKSVKKFLTKF